MDNELIGKGNGEGDQKKNMKNEESFRIAIIKKVDEEIGEMIIKVNDGFNAGKVNRPQLVNWILSRFYASFGETEIKAIRADHFDEISMLDSILRQARETGRVPNEIRALLQKQMGLDDLAKKSGKTKLTKNSINDGIAVEE